MDQAVKKRAGKRRRRRISLGRTLLAYIIVFSLMAMALSMATGIVCTREIQRIRDAYPANGEKYYLTTQDGKRLGEGTYISTQGTLVTGWDKTRLNVLEIWLSIAGPCYSAVCILLAVFLFYTRRLKIPIGELKRAAQKIEQNELDFSIAYASQDEIGQLCAAFERMRAALERDFARMWRQLEARTRVNAAFMHDLRTPLTVLKGYGEMLCAGTDEETVRTAQRMQKQIERLEAYARSMGALRRMEEAEPQRQTVSAEELSGMLYETAMQTVKPYGKEIVFHAGKPTGTLAVDTEFVMRVLDNLSSNAARYARRTIEVAWSIDEKVLLITVCDDGEGFAPECLEKATEPYFTQERGEKTHFGLGLYISKTLCENHGGFLCVENTASGGKVTAAFGQAV